MAWKRTDDGAYENMSDVGCVTITLSAKNSNGEQGAIVSIVGGGTNLNFTVPPTLNVEREVGIVRENIARLLNGDLGVWNIDGIMIPDVKI